MVKQAPHLTLVGRYISPPVRRVGACMIHQGVVFEHSPLSTADPADFERLRQIAPLGRVPALVLAGAEVLVESTAILEYIDDLVDDDRALLPRSGNARRDALQMLALATGACDKLVAIGYELTRRPEAFRYRPWIDQCQGQALAALQLLDQRLVGHDWLAGPQVTQADFAATIALDLASRVIGPSLEGEPLEALRRLRASETIESALSQVKP